jgi:hypothetical protein
LDICTQPKRENDKPLIVVVRIFLKTYLLLRCGIAKIKEASSERYQKTLIVDGRKRYQFFFFTQASGIFNKFFFIELRKKQIV